MTETISKLNIGCGFKKLSGYLNIDKSFHDLNVFPYPFKTESFDEIIAHNILEHLDDLIGTMQELHRILKRDGKLDIIVPHYLSGTAWGNPEHKRAFTKHTFKYFTEKYDVEERYTNCFFRKCESRIIWSKLIFPMGVRCILTK